MPSDDEHHWKTNPAIFLKACNDLKNVHFDMGENVCDRCIAEQGMEHVKSMRTKLQEKEDMFHKTLTAVMESSADKEHQRAINSVKKVMPALSGAIEKVMKKFINDTMIPQIIEKVKNGDINFHSKPAPENIDDVLNGIQLIADTLLDEIVLPGVVDLINGIDIMSIDDQDNDDMSDKRAKTS